MMSLAALPSLLQDRMWTTEARVWAIESADQRRVNPSQMETDIRKSSMPE
jgi:hypothetical protein